MESPANLAAAPRHFTLILRRHLKIVGATLLSLFVATASTVAAAEQSSITLSSSQFIPNSGDCNGNGVADRQEPAAANRDDDGDGVCNGVDNCPLEAMSCPMQAITVPARADDPMAAHVTYSGATTRLKGIARYGGNQHMWDFGDGSAPTAWTAITSAYNLGVNHTYTGAVGQTFTATLSVRSSANPSVVTSATYPIVIKDGGASLASLTREQTDVRAQMAIDNALWYLHTVLARATYGDGAPGYSQGYATIAGGLADNCAVVAAFAAHGHEAARPWTVTVDENGYGTDLIPYRYDPYIEDARRLLNYMSANAVARPITAQAAGNPDENSNGIGVSIGPDHLWTDSVCAMAFAESGGTDWFAGTGPSNVYGRPHTAVAQDLAEWLAFGQADASQGAGRGGWGYTANLGATNDVTRWAVLALMPLEARMGATTPAFVRAEMPFWMNYSRYMAADPLNGSSGYDGPNNVNNVAFTAGSLLSQLFIGETASHPVAQRATGFIARKWLENDGQWRRNLSDSNTMYSAARTFRTAQPAVRVISDFDYINNTPVSSGAFNWYYGPVGAPQLGYAGNLLARQSASGFFTDSFAFETNGFVLSGKTALGAMVLARAGAPATATASPASLDFGAIDVNTTSPAQLVTLTNDGDHAFAFDSITASGPFVVTSTCGSLLPPAGEGVANDCAATVAFAPIAGGAASGVLTVAGSSGAPTTTIPLSGVGTAPKLTPAINWPPSAISYGTALDATQLNATADVDGTFVYTPEAGVTLDAGTGQLLIVTFTPADADHYSSVTTTTFVDVAPASPALVLTAGTVEYDGQPHTASATATGVNGESLGPIATAYDGQPGPPVTAGTYAVVATLAANGNYAAATANATLVITKATPVVAWPAPAAITYGTTLDVAQLNATASVAGTFSYTPAAGTALNGGAGQALSVTFAPDDSINYAGATAATMIDVAPATPAVTVTGGTYTYDGQSHTATASATGVNGESLGSLTVTYGGEPAAPSAAGTYPVVATLAASGNYESATAPATLTIERKAANVTAGSGTKIYGAPDPVITPAAAGFLAADGIVVAPAGRDAGQDVGMYTTRATASGAALSNYIVTYATGSLQVTSAALTVTAHDATRSYGTPNPAFTGTLATVVPGDAITATYTTPAALTSPLGAYPIVPALLDPAGRLANYHVTLVPGTLTVTNSPPVCTAVTASPLVIWPVNHQWVNVSLSGAQDAESGPLQFRIASIFQDEPTGAGGEGHNAIDGRGVGTSTAAVRAERLGTGNGRVYRIAFEVTDQGGLSCTGSVTVGVPHHQRTRALDDGPRYDSTRRTAVGGRREGRRDGRRDE